MMHQQQTPDHSNPDPFTIAFMRGIAAAMSGDQGGTTRATADNQAAMGDVIKQAGGES